MNRAQLKLKLNRLGKRKWFSTPVINNHYFVVLTNSTNDRQQRLSRRHKRRIETLDNSLRVGDCSSLLLRTFRNRKTPTDSIQLIGNLSLNGNIS